MENPGWHEMGNDQKAHGVEYITWNPKKNQRVVHARRGKHDLPRHDRMEWTWTERGAVGKMELKGTSKRQPP